MTTKGLITLVVGLGSLAFAGCTQQTQPQTTPTTRTTDAPPPAPTTTDSQPPPAPTTKANWKTITQESTEVASDSTITANSISSQSLPQPIQEFNVRETGFRVVYGASRKPMYTAVKRAFQKERMFETFASQLNRMIKMPRVIDIQMTECKTVNAFYDPRRSRIIMCYELVAYFAKLFQPVSSSNAALGNSIKGATTFAFYHELGHALAHALKLPVVGREEDAVDQLATLILMGGGDAGVAAAMSGARWFDLQSKRRGRKMPFWDEHSLDPQRFYNIACLVFGSNPRKYSWLVRRKVLPMKRARRCPTEYKKISKAWNRLLKPHIRSTHRPPTTTTTTTTAPPPTRPTTIEPVPAKPVPAEPTQPTQPTRHASSDCSKVAIHIGALLKLKVTASTRNMHPGQAQQTLGQLNARMPTFLLAVLKECRKKWSAPVRQCVLRARTLKRAGGCDKFK